MPLIDVEHACRSAELGFKKDRDGDIVVVLKGFCSIAYPTLVYEYEGQLQAIVWFPQPEHHTIENTEDLCTLLLVQLSPHALAGFNPEKGRFWAGCRLDGGEILPKLSALAQACDILFPLVERVGCLGRWDEELVKLAFTMPEECGHA